jgi:DNA-binding response OmpR family regulator
MASAPASPSSAKRVLVVDDNEDIRDFLVEFLAEQGHDAHGVGSAEAAEERLSGESFDVLFTDVGLPGISGLELAGRALAQSPEMRIVLATGLTHDALSAHGDLLARATVLIKPYDEAAILAAVERN